MGMPNFLCLLHYALGFAIPLGVGQAQVAKLLLFHIAALLLTDEHDCLIIESGWTSDNGVVITRGAITMQFKKVLAHELDIIK